MTLPVPEDLSIFKKHSFPKQGSSPGKEHHDPRPLSGRERRSAQHRIPQGAPKCGKISASAISFRITDYRNSKMARVLSFTQKKKLNSYKNAHLKNHSFQQNFENLFPQLVFCGFMKANQYTVDIIISFYYILLKGYTTNLE